MYLCVVVYSSGIDYASPSRSPSYEVAQLIETREFKVDVAPGQVRRRQLVHTGPPEYGLARANADVMLTLPLYSEYSGVRVLRYDGTA